MQVAEAKQLADPPLLRLELEASHAYLAMLTQLGGDQAQHYVAQGARVEERTVAATLATLEAFLVRPCCHSSSRGLLHRGCLPGELLLHPAPGLHTRAKGVEGVPPASQQEGSHCTQGECSVENGVRPHQTWAAPPGGTALT